MPVVDSTGGRLNVKMLKPLQNFVDTHRELCNKIYMYMLADINVNMLQGQHTIFWHYDCHNLTEGPSGNSEGTDCTPVSVEGMQ